MLKLAFFNLNLPIKKAQKKKNLHSQNLTFWLLDANFLGICFWIGVEKNETKKNIKILIITNFLKNYAWHSYNGNLVFLSYLTWFILDYSFHIRSN